MNKFFLLIMAVLTAAVTLGCPGMDGKLRPLLKPGEVPDLEFPTTGGMVAWEQNFNSLPAVLNSAVDLNTWPATAGLVYYGTRATSATPGDNSTFVAVGTAGIGSLNAKPSGSQYLAMNKPGGTASGPNATFILAHNLGTPLASGKVLFEASIGFASFVAGSMGDFEGTGTNVYPRFMLYAAGTPLANAATNPTQGAGPLGVVFNRQLFEMNTAGIGGIPGTYQESAWYDMRIIFDLDANMYRVEVKRSGTATVILNGGGSIDSNFQVAQVGLYAQNPASGVGLDDIKVTTYSN